MILLLADMIYVLFRVNFPPPCRAVRIGAIFIVLICGIILPLF